MNECFTFENEKIERRKKNPLLLNIEIEGMSDNGPAGWCDFKANVACFLLFFSVWILFLEGSMKRGEMRWLADPL